MTHTTTNADIWSLVCQLFPRRKPTRVIMLSEPQAATLKTLQEIKAVQARVVDLTFVLCTYCLLHSARVLRQSAQGDRALVCWCPDCGEVKVDLADCGAAALDVDWLIRKLRGAMDIPPSQVAVPLVDGVWRIGTYRHTPVVLASNLDLLLYQPAVLTRAKLKSSSAVFLITPKPPHAVDIEGLVPGLTWLPLEERFAWYGGNLRFLPPDTGDDDSHRPGLDGATEPHHGPFSADFRVVHLPAVSAIPIELSATQAAVFKALWEFAGVPQEAPRIMSRAGSRSDKPNDVFKIKPHHKGDPKYEDPKAAYRHLVVTHQQAGTYAMPCAHPEHTRPGHPQVPRRIDHNG